MVGTQSSSSAGSFSKRDNNQGCGNCGLEMAGTQSSSSASSFAERDINHGCEQCDIACGTLLSIQNQACKKNSLKTGFCLLHREISRD
jgi:hypothetical protein